MISIREEDESYDSTDESMELIIEDTETSDYYVDNLGRLHDKVTGKFVKKRKE